METASKKTQSSNWEEAKKLLDTGKINEAIRTKEIPENENWEYSVIVKSGYIWGADFKNGIWTNIKGQEISKYEIIAWQKHQKIDVISPENQNPFSTGGEGFW